MLHASNPTLKIPEEQDPIGRAHVELKSLASILYELRKQLQYGSGDLNFAHIFSIFFESYSRHHSTLKYLRILIPDLDGPLHDRGVRRVDPVEQHHVGRLNTKQLLIVKFNVLINWLIFLGFNLGIEGKSNSSEISGEPYYCFPNLRMYKRLHNAHFPPISRCRY